MGRADGDIDSVSLIDLTQSPPRAVSTTSMASGREPMKFSPDGRFLAVGAEFGTILAPGARFYHDHGLLQVFAVDGSTLTQVATGPVGRWVEGIAWSRDGKTVLISMPDLVPTGGPVAFGVSWP